MYVDNTKIVLYKIYYIIIFMEIILSRTRGKNLGPDPVDIQLGGKVRSRRLLMGLSQEGLAKLIGLTFQQVQKYERGTNRISVSRLVDICSALKVPMNYFINEGISLAGAQPKLAKGFSDTKQESLSVEEEPLTKRDVLELVRAYSKIKSPKMKKQILEMAKVMSTAQVEE